MMDLKAHNKFQIFFIAFFFGVVLMGSASLLLAQDEDAPETEISSEVQEEQARERALELELEQELEDESTEMEDFPIVKLQSLDKVTARTMTFEAKVGGTVKFGEIYIKVQACRKAPPLEAPESAAFLQIWEVTEDEEAAWIFSGWMFASSPALSHMDHPIYDVWVLDCLAEKGEPAKETQDQALEGEGEVDEEDIPVQPEAAPTSGSETP